MSASTVSSFLSRVPVETSPEASAKRLHIRREKEVLVALFIDKRFFLSELKGTLGVDSSLGWAPKPHFLKHFENIMLSIDFQARVIHIIISNDFTWLSGL